MNTINTNPFTIKRQIFLAILISAILAAFVVVPYASKSLVVFAAIKIDFKGGTESTILQFVDIGGVVMKYIGIALTLYGLINIILAYRREDGEEIVRSLRLFITSAILIGVGISVESIYHNIVG